MPCPCGLARPGLRWAARYSVTAPVPGRPLPARCGNTVAAGGGWVGAPIPGPSRRAAPATSRPIRSMAEQAGFAFRACPRFHLSSCCKPVAPRTASTPLAPLQLRSPRLRANAPPRKLRQPSLAWPRRGRDASARTGLRPRRPAVGPAHWSRSCVFPPSPTACRASGGSYRLAPHQSTPMLSAWLSCSLEYANNPRGRYSRAGPPRPTVRPEQCR